jgi:hypothetical protein
MRLSVPPYLNDGRPAQRSCLSSPGSIILPIQSCISTILLLYAYRYIHISVCLVHHHTVLINKSRRKMIPLVSMGRPTWDATCAVLARRPRTPARTSRATDRPATASSMFPVADRIMATHDMMAGRSRDPVVVSCHVPSSSSTWPRTGWYFQKPETGVLVLSLSLVIRITRFLIYPCLNSCQVTTNVATDEYIQY